MSNELQGRNVGKTLRVHYKGTFNDGTQFVKVRLPALMVTMVRSSIPPMTVASRWSLSAALVR